MYICDIKEFRDPVSVFSAVSGSNSVKAVIVASSHNSPLAYNVFCVYVKTTEK